jgi:hypothetical protein
MLLELPEQQQQQQCGGTLGVCSSLERTQQLEGWEHGGGGSEEVPNRRCLRLPGSSTAPSAVQQQ